MLKKLLSFILGLYLFCSLYAQGTAGTSSKFEYRSLIDMPTAGVLEKGFVGITMDAMPAGVVITKLEVGVFTNFSFGFSYGADNLIGSGNPGWYDLPGINARLRVFDETETMPAITLGFDSQGKGIYDKELKRFEIKSPGFFAAIAKNFELLGYLSLHGGINYSLERDDDDKDLNGWIGVEKTIGGRVSFFAEYDFAINDNGAESYGDGRGYFNVGLRWSVGEGFTIGMDLRNLTDNKNTENSFIADRAIFVEYIKSIF